MKELNKKIQEQFNQMSKSGKLFRVQLGGNEVWDLYLMSFTNDPVFRDPNSSVHNCNLCKSTIRRYGNVVSIDKDYNISSIFDIDIEGEYSYTVKELSKVIKASKISDVFFETFDSLKSLPYESCTKNNQIFQLGVAQNHKRYTKEEALKFGVVKEGEIRTFNHFHLFLDKQYVDMSGLSVEAIMGQYRDAKNVFQRAMNEISLDTLELVKDLINQGSLLDGTTHLFKVEQMIPLKKEYDSLPAKKRENWCWDKSYKFSLAKFRNELIGTLCSDLSEGVDLNKACQDWNRRVDPANYMKTTAPITKRQIEDAKKFVEENGYVESFNRRFATLEDIKVSEILHSNVGSGKIKSISMFDTVKPTKTKVQSFEGLEEVGIEKFMTDILPGCTSVEAYVTNKHQGNFVSLTTSAEDSKPIFKWNNPYSWTYNGNLAGKSLIKQAVQTKGGKVDGVLRFSIMWADGDGDNSDLDAHCYEPTGHIYYSNKSVPSRGNLDVDIINPGGRIAVENITYPSLDKMKDGTYKFSVHPYSPRNSKGFKAEIEYNGQIYSYEYKKPLGSTIEVATVTLYKGEFSIIHALPETQTNAPSMEVYGLETNNFHKVNLVCLSPNHWGDNNVGNKHYFFMLNDCKAPEDIRTFHSENLLPELAEHRRTLEILGATNKIESTDNQLSGLGFNSTIPEELIVKVEGANKKMLKIKF